MTLLTDAQAQEKRRLLARTEAQRPRAFDAQGFHGKPLRRFPDGEDA